MLSPIATILAVLLPLTHALSLNIDSPSSIHNASASLAYNLMSYYQTNRSGTPPENVGTLPQPLYWWQAGAMWGGLVDYFAFTNDSSYNPTITQALQAQVGPNNNYMPPAYFSSLGNDDQAFWALAVLSAAESGFPSPSADQPQWLALAEAVFNTQWPRWETDTCGGGLKWQIFESNAGYYYKNTVSNGAFFQIAARLARYTGNQTYVEWADRAWNWMEAIGLFDGDYNVFDGTDEKINCTELNHISWSYNPALLIHGTASLYNYTNGSAIWEERTSGLLRSTIRNFYSLPNATNILYEQACEPFNTCNNDQYSFKAYASRFLGKTAVLAPYTLPAIRTLLTTSAEAAAVACSSGADNATCGQKWYVGGFDGNPGIGQQMSGLESVQALIAMLPHGTFPHTNATHVNGTSGGGSAQKQQWVPRTGPNVTIAVRAVTSTFVAETPTGTPSGPPGQPGAGSEGSSGGDGSGKGESTGALQGRAELGVKAALPLIAAAAVESSLPRTTASSSTPKKRKLAPFVSLSQHTAETTAPFDTATYQTHLRESSSPPQSLSNAPSPEEGRASPSTGRPGALPSHVQEEIAGAGVGSAGQSPSGAFAEINIHSGSSTDMSGSENGQDSSVKTDNETHAEIAEFQRAASPAKRSAGEMEGTGKHGNAAQQPDSNEDVAMAGMSNDLYDHDTGANTASTSLQGTMSTNTSATSFQSEDPPPYSAEDSNGEQWKVAGGAPLPSIGEQVREVTQLSNKPVEHGDRGNIISVRWLQRVRARTTEELNSTKFPKAAREGEIGPVDNSDIVPSNAFEEPILYDINGHPYIPLKQGLTMEEDFMVLPDDAWGKIIGWYGIAKGQKQITRYAHNTAPDDAAMANVVYELNPPVFLVRKVPQPARDGDKDDDKSRSAAKELRMKSERRQRGQMKAGDALMVVSSRQEKGHKFLTRVKEYAEIPLSHKVKIWRVLNPTNIAVDTPDNMQSGVVSPPLSRDTSPSSVPLERTKLVVEAVEWQKMEIGKDIEHIDMPDQTANANYNGSSTIEIFSLFENQTLILEEQTRGPAGGEYLSDQKKKLAAKSNASASKPGSTVTSRRTSPAPGGVITRGRRRDGKTRGTVGLSNLGNTCYMNSALQCIRSVEELAIYFLQDKYKSEINPSNPLGSGGIMAKKYAEVLQGIYGENSSSAFSPNNFKRTLSSQNPVFSGWGQQDSQEFLSYLVDSIHEDLNRIQKKPYLENPDSDDARVNDPEYIKELGDTYRQNHAKRNESVCMDLFSGFYKNTMECPDCEKVSVTFDPFASLTLQLPIESTVMIRFTFVPLVGTPKNHDLDLEKNLTVRDIKRIVASKHDNVEASKLWMVEVYNHKIYKHFDDQTSVAEANIQGNDYIFLFELAEVPSNIPPRIKSSYTPSYSYGKRSEDVPEMDSYMAEDFAVPIFHRRKNRYGSGWELIMHPQYITVKRDEAKDYNTILKKVLHTVAQLTSRPILMEAETERSSDTGKTETEGDVDARLSDHSVSSEDGYVSVSVNGDNQAMQTNEAVDEAQSAPIAEAAKVPDGFYDPDFNLPEILRDQLFTMNYARGQENMFCTGTTGFEEKSVRNVKPRVKAPSRRLSSSSSTAGDSSANDGSSPASTAVDEEESDEDEETSMQMSAEDPPALVDDEESETADSELPDDPIQPPVVSRMRGNKKENKFKGNKTRKTKEKRPSKKEKKELKKARARESQLQSPRSVRSNDDPEDETYYIKLGECILLDWYPEAIDSIFAGDRNDAADVRGRWLSNEEGKGLPLVHDPASEAKRQRRELRKKNGITLEDCFMETGKREKLSEDNAWYCNRCKELRQATKTLEIWTCPDIVVVHLKRFGGTRSFRDKIDVMVDYPIEGLDLTEKIGQKEDGKEYLYDLFAVDNHFGGLGGGHYTGCAKNFFDGQWYDYNDSSVSKVGAAPRKSAAAYLLFYRRRSDKPLGPQYLQDLVNDFRNPPQQNNSADEAYESDSGEGRLGDPSSTLRGSSSNSVGAGAGASTGLQTQALKALQGAGGNGSAGQQAARTLKQKSQGTSDDEGISMSMGDEEQPATNRQYGNIGPSSWSFASLDNPADHDAEMLLDKMNVDTRTADADDADSTAAEQDYSDQEHDFGDMHSWNDHDESFTLGDGYSDDTYQEDEDDNIMYSTSCAHAASENNNQEVGSMHLEDTSMLGSDDHHDHDPTAVDITLSSEDTSTNAKMD